VAKTLKKYLAAVDYSLDEDVVPFVVKYVSIDYYFSDQWCVTIGAYCFTLRRCDLQVLSSSCCTEMSQQHSVGLAVTAIYSVL
jgi:hypothetical protein